jgi:hypothetical protein
LPTTTANAYVERAAVREDTGLPISEDVYAVPLRFEHLEKLTLRLKSD